MVIADTSSAIGASLTALTVTVNVCELVNSPSDTVAVKSSEPLKFSVAVKLTLAPSTVAVISVSYTHLTLPTICSV